MGRIDCPAVVQPNLNFCVIKQKGNQVEIKPAEGGETTRVHVTDIKKVIPADHISAQLPDYKKLRQLTKLRLNPKSIPDLDWQLASELHPSLALYKTAKISDQITATTQATSMVTAEIVTKTIKLSKIRVLSLLVPPTKLPK